ncbi:MAG: deoxyuridine 5'-triphosphate nucleotidohydrolase [Malacoplasma sp.]|nr:deoxyuridine 5'-triphosphate nucleotidohydrolase [Malacoplasma sp.]
MNKIAKFEKISIDQFKLDFNDLNILVYNDIKLPQRATKYSAGYDFYLPYDINLKPKQTIKIPTGIRVKIQSNYVLLLFPRSSLGFKYRMQLDNTIGVVDADYYRAKNEGHIFVKITNDNNENKDLFLEKNTAFAQGIFINYGITIDDDVQTIREGGMGSTDNNKKSQE